MEKHKKILIDLFIAITATVVGGLLLNALQNESNAQSEIYTWLFVRLSPPDSNSVCSTIEKCGLFTSFILCLLAIFFSFVEYFIEREDYNIKRGIVFFVGALTIGLISGIGIYHFYWEIGINRIFSLTVLLILVFLALREYLRG